MINVIIPAAGIGTRLRPLTHTAPKAMLHVAGKPILGHILDHVATLPDLGTIYLVVGFLAEQIEDYVESHYDLDIQFVHQADLRGLGFAVHLAMDHVKSDDPLLIILGDTIVETDLAAFMAGPDEALGVKEVDDPRRFGVVETGKDNLVKRLVEKPPDPPSNLAVIGLYGIKKTALLRECLNDVVARNQTAAGELQMTDALQLMIERGSRMEVKVVEHWYDCGKPETLLSTNRHLLESHTEKYDLEETVVIPPSFVAPTAKVERAIIGPYASIGDGAAVSESVIVNSIVSEGAKVLRCVLEESLIGSNASVYGHIHRLNVGESSVIGLSS
jgi:glucose-1-phosphate thymidylyltransferase